MKYISKFLLSITATLCLCTLLPITAHANTVKTNATTRLATIKNNYTDKTAQKQKPVILGWTNNLSSINANVSVVSTTWFNLSNTPDGSLINSSPQMSVISKLHSQGYLIEPLVGNGNESGDQMQQILNNESTANALEENIIQAVQNEDLDGINIDFEGLPSDQPDLQFTAFITALSSKIHALNKEISVDVPAFYNWEHAYQYKQLSDSVDYLNVMTYDQHSCGDSDGIGSTSGLIWAESSIDKIIQLGVPANKILMGIPLYSILWLLDSQGKIISSQKIPYTKQQDIIEQNNAQISYDAATKQNVATFESGNCTYKIWLEDDQSVIERMQLTKKLNIRGICICTIDYATQQVWNDITQNI